MIYVKKLNKLVDEIFEESNKRNWTGRYLAIKAGLCPATVYNLWHYKTRRPQLRTVYQMAQAVGFDIELRKIK